MNKKIKSYLFVAFLTLIIIALVKDKIFDIPQRSVQKLTSWVEARRRDDVRTNVFKTKKTIIYKMYLWSIIPMGEMRLTTSATSRDYFFVLEASTKGSFVDHFIKSRARLESYVDRDTLLPTEYVEKTDYKGKTKIKKLFFDQQGLTVTREDKKIRIPFGTHDPLSGFMDMLTWPLDVGETQSTRLISKEVLYVLRRTVLNNIGRISEILVDIRREDQSSRHGATFRVWVTSDNARIPLVFKCWTPIGYVSVILEGVE